jgi:hypothetical protein
MISKIGIARSLERLLNDIPLDNQYRKQCEAFVEAVNKTADGFPEVDNKTILQEKSTFDLRDLKQKVEKEIKERENEEKFSVIQIVRTNNGEVIDIYLIKEQKNTSKALDYLVDKLSPLEILDVKFEVSVKFMEKAPLKEEYFEDFKQ